MIPGNVKRTFFEQNFKMPSFELEDGTILVHSTNGYISPEKRTEIINKRNEAIKKYNQKNWFQKLITPYWNNPYIN